MSSKVKECESERGRPKSCDDNVSSRTTRRRIEQDLLMLVTNNPLRSPECTADDSATSDDPIESPVDTSTINHEPSESRVTDELCDLIAESDIGCDTEGDEWLDAESFTTVNFECDICTNCRCDTCNLCRHVEGGECFHCGACFDERFSDVEDEEITFCDESDSDDEFDIVQPILPEEEVRNNQIKQDLVDIALKHNASHELLNDFLAFLRKYEVGNLPKSAKTLMRTPQFTSVRPVPLGEYWHYGVTKHIQSYLEAGNTCTSIEICFSVDGLPISNSSSSNFWPILCSFNKSSAVYLVGAYHGMDKPQDPNEFLKDFVDELIPLCLQGFKYKDQLVQVAVTCVVCDAPAKSFILNCKGHNAYFGCTKCKQEGEMIGRRMSYIEVDAELRSDFGFFAQEQEEFHKGKTILEKIPGFGPVSCIPLDWLHLVLLGVLRKLIYMWIKGPLHVRLRAAKVLSLSAAMVQLSQWVPHEFVRRPRSFQYVKRFKGTEFRQLLLYTGPVVFLKVLPRNLYEHFLVLHVAITILVDATFIPHYLSFARDLMKYFVQSFIKLYGPDYVSHNVHNLIHLPDDVAHFGPLEYFDAFKFENFLQKVKKIIRKGHKPLQQLARRYSEITAHYSYSPKISASSEYVLKGPHTKGPLFGGCGGPQYSSCILRGGVRLDLLQANNCCVMINGAVVVIENFAHSLANGESVIIGREFKTREDLYTVPCPSSLFGILIVSCPLPVNFWPLSAIHQKCYRMPLDNGFVVVPIHHSVKD